MAVYKSKYAELTFYVDGEPRKFKGGRYVANDKKEIEVLDSLTDATKVDEVKPKEAVKPEVKAEVKETPKQAPTKQAITTRKTSGK